MYTSFHLKASELDEDFLKTIKTIFKSKRISITIEEEMDETEYLLSTEANSKHLMESISEVKKGNTVKISAGNWKKFRESDNVKDLHSKKVDDK